MYATETLSHSQTCHELFGSMPRFIGPMQRQVNSMQELMSHMTSQSGIMNSFVSVYSFYPINNPVIDKIFLENEYKDKQTSLRIGQSLFEECTEKYKLPTIPIWSGNRSPHIFPLFKPTLVDNPTELIKKVAYKIVHTSNNYYIDPKSYKKIPYIDSKVLEPRRLCRFPNTRRSTPSGTPSPNYCIILDPERFPDMSLTEISDLSSSPQNLNIKIPTERTKKITDIPVKDINLNEWNGMSISFSQSQTTHDIDTSKINSSSVDFVLDRLISRPCTRKGISVPNPRHIIRQNFVAELIEKNASPDFVNLLFSLLSPFDYDAEKTDYQVRWCYKGNFKAWGYKHINNEGLCCYDINNPICIKCKH